MPAGRPKGSKNKPKPGQPGWVEQATNRLRAVNGQGPINDDPRPQQPPIEVKAERVPPDPEEKKIKKPIPPMPRIVSDFIAEIPYKIALGASEEFILNRGLPDSKRTKISPEDKTLDALHEAFATWLQSLELDAGPGAQMIIANVAACGAVALGAGIKRGVINAQMRAEDRKTKADAKPQAEVETK